MADGGLRVFANPSLFSAKRGFARGEGEEALRKEEKGWEKR